MMSPLFTDETGERECLKTAADEKREAGYGKLNN